VADIHADIDALKEFRDALARFRYTQREVADRGDYQIAATRASLEEKASRWRSLLAQRQADLAACQHAAALAAEAGGGGDGGGGGGGAGADCSAEAAAVREAEERLEHIRRWQQRVEEQASAFYGPASRFRNLLDVDLPRTESHLLAIINGLEDARGIQVRGF
jgi:hypothetical protein